MFKYNGVDLAFSKKITFSKDAGFDVRYKFDKNQRLQGHDFGVEFNLSLQSAKDILINGHKFSLDKGCVIEKVSSFEVKDLFKNNRIAFSCDKSDVWVMPVYSVSSSESGFERAYQQISVLFINREHKDSYFLSCEFKKV